MSDRIIGEHREGEMYEGEKPYVFISYSHRNTADMVEIVRAFQDRNIRFWYDNGLHSGDDWNLIIAKHLEKASICLLLLSRDASTSLHVKNELNFAINHRIPIHTLLLNKFSIPIDVEMMIGRIQMIEKNTGYVQRLLEALPSELYDSLEEHNDSERKSIDHPLFSVMSEEFSRQGTVSYLGYHKTMGYKVLIQEDQISNVNPDMLHEQIQLVSQISHPLFPKIYDITINGNSMFTYQQYRGEEFLDSYLLAHSLGETEIVSWIDSVVDAMDYLFTMNLGLRDFSRGSMVVCDGSNIGMFRLQNMYYGLVRLKQETKQFYFENEIQEIGVLLYQLCMREIPVLPFRMISGSEHTSGFVNKMNLIIQKCSRENHRLRYSSFAEIRTDLGLKHLRLGDIRFLRTRKSKLRRYEEIKEGNLY